MYEKIVVSNDWHIPFEDKKALELFYTFIKSEKPDRIVLGGDVMDCWEISKFDKVPKVGKQLTKEIQITRSYLERLRNIAPQAEIIYIEGNHDFRLKQYLIRNAPELYGLSGLSIQELLHLDELGIKYVGVREGANRFSELRKETSNEVFDNLDQVEQALASALSKYFNNPQLVSNLTLFPYIRKSLN